MAQVDRPTPDEPRMPHCSAFDHSVHDLLSRGVFQAPSHPGVLARIGGYDLLGRIGQGGMGWVYQGRSVANGKSVAIKVLRPELTDDPRALERFRLEARHMRQLLHPHIVSVLEIHDGPGVPFFVMPRLTGGSLAERLREEGPLPADQGLSLAIQVAEAVDHAHRRGIVHRDLKPANILFDDQGAVKLTDFGLARDLFNQTIADVNREHCEGTAPYCSPAVAAGQAEDTRTDIYALGALLYEMLAGRPPYSGANDREIFAKIRSGPPPPLARVNPALPADLVAVVEAAMAREVRDRYASMGDLLEDLRGLERGERTRAARAPDAKPADKDRVKRRPGGLRWLALPAVLLAALIVLGLLALRSRLIVVRVLEKPQIANWAGALVGRWDDNATPDFFVPVDESRRWLAVTAEGELSPDGPFSVVDAGDAPLRLSGPQDVNGDGLDELFVSWPARTNVVLEARNDGNVRVRRYLLPGTVHVRSNGLPAESHAALAGTADVDGDGRIELLAFLYSGFAHPRGLYCFDLLTQTARWAFPTAVGPLDLCPVDLDGDATPELVFGSRSSDNAVNLADGTDDQHAYLFAVDGNGALRWRRELAGYYTTARPLVVTQPGTAPRIYAWIECSRALRIERGDPEVGFVARLDPRDGSVTHRYDPGTNLVAALATDFEGSGPVQILAADRAGTLHLLDENLELLRRARPRPESHDETAWTFAGVASLRPNSYPVFVVGRRNMEVRNQLVTGVDLEQRGTQFFHHPTLLLLDRNLGEVAAYPLPGRTSKDTWQLRLLDIDADGTVEIVWLDQALRILKPRGGRWF